MVKKKKVSPFKRLQQPDDVLADIVGSKPKTRGMIMKRFWEYIKKNKLQSKKDGRVILCSKDKKLKALFKKDEIQMLGPGAKGLSILAKHIEAAED